MLQDFVSSHRFFCDTCVKMKLHNYEKSDEVMWFKKHRIIFIIIIIIIVIYL